MHSDSNKERGLDINWAEPKKVLAGVYRLPHLFLAAPLLTQFL